LKIFKILQKTFFIFIILSLLMPAGFISAENDLQILFHDFFQDFINLYPEWGVETGITEDMGYSLRRDTLNDISYDTALREINMYEDYLKKLNAIESKNLSEPEKCDYDVLKWYLEIMIEKKDFLNHDYLVTHMFDIPLWTITNLVEYQNVNTKGDTEAYIKKLSLFDYKMNQLVERVKEQEEANIIPPKKIFERVDKTILNQIPDTLKNCELYKSFERKIKGAKLSDKEKRDYLAGLEEEFSAASLKDKTVSGISNMKQVFLSADELNTVVMQGGYNLYNINGGRISVAEAKGVYYITEKTSGRRIAKKIILLY